MSGLQHEIQRYKSPFVIRADTSELLGHKLSLLLSQHVLGGRGQMTPHLKASEGKMRCEPGLLSVLTTSLAGAGSAFLTSAYLLQSNHTALSVC